MFWCMLVYIERRYVFVFDGQNLSFKGKNILYSVMKGE